MDGKVLLRTALILNDTIIRCQEASAKNITNPFIFEGAGKNPLNLVWNMLVMLRSVTSFLDLNRIRTTNTSEYILRSQPTTVGNCLQALGLDRPYQIPCLQEPVWDRIDSAAGR